MPTCMQDYYKLTDERYKHMQGVSKDVLSLMNMSKFLSEEDAVKRFINEESAVASANDFIQQTTTRKTIEDFDKNATDAERRFVQQVIESKIRMFADVGVDAVKLREEQMISDNLFRVYRNLYKKDKASRFLQSITQRIGGVLADPSRVLQQHPVARRLKARYEFLANSLQHNASVLVRDGIAKLTMENPIPGLDARALIEFLPKLDGVGHENTPGNRARLYEIYDDFRASGYFDKYRDELRKSDASITDRMVNERFVHELSIFRDRWNILNYGVKDPTDKGYEWWDPKYSMSIVGFIYNAGRQLRELALEHERVAGKNALLPAQRRIIDLFDPDKISDPSDRTAFHPRLNNYVPSKVEMNKDIFSQLIFTDPSDILPGLPKLFEHRERAFHDTKDFTAIARENVLSIVHSFDLLGQYSMAAGINAAAEKTPPEWFRNTPEIKSAMTWWSGQYLDMLRKYKKPKSALVEASRNLALGVTSLNALMLSMPKSGITNLGGGFVGALSELGFEFKDTHAEYHRALKGDTLSLEHETAKAVSKIVEEQFVQGNRMLEFIKREGTVDSDNSLLVSATKIVRDKAMGLADISTGKGVLGFIPFLENLSLKNTEERMRRWAGPILFELVSNEVAAKGIDAETDPKLYQKAIADAIEHNKEEAFYRINAALGDFSSNNRPFWSWAKLKYADSLSDVMVGATLTMWYAFRHVAAHNMNLLSRVAIDTIYPQEQNAKAFMKQGAGAGGLLIMLLCAYDLATKMFKRDIPRSNMLQNINPLQEVGAVADWAGVYMFAPWLNISVSEEHADEAATSLARLAGGVMFGYSLERAVESMGENDKLMGSFGTIVERLKHVASLDTGIMNYLNEMSYQDYKDTKQTTREFMDNPINLINYTNGFLRFYSQMLPLAARGITPNDEKAIAKQKARDITNALASAFGFSFSSAPELWKRAEYGNSRYWSEYTRTALNARELFGDDPRDFEYSPMGRMLNQMRRYGRIYPQSVWGISVD